MRFPTLLGGRSGGKQTLSVAPLVGMCLVTQSCLTFCDPMYFGPPGSSIHGDSPGNNTGVGCHALLQRIFPTQGSNPGLPASQADSLPAELPGMDNPKA